MTSLLCHTIQSNQNNTVTIYAIFVKAEHTREKYESKSFTVHQIAVCTPYFRSHYWTKTDIIQCIKRLFTNFFITLRTYYIFNQIAKRFFDNILTNYCITNWIYVSVYRIEIEMNILDFQMVCCRRAQNQT